MKTKTDLKRHFKNIFLTVLFVSFALVCFLLGTHHEEGPIVLTKDAYWERQEQSDSFRYYLKKPYVDNALILVQCRDNKFVSSYANGTMVRILEGGQIHDLKTITLDGVQYSVPRVTNETDMRSKESLPLLKALTQARIVSFTFQNESFVWKVENQTYFSRCNTY